MAHATQEDGDRQAPRATLTAGLVYDSTDAGPTACGAVIVACEHDTGRVGAELIEGCTPDLVITGLDQIISTTPFRRGRLLGGCAPELCTFEVRAWCGINGLVHITSDPQPEALIAELAGLLAEGFSEAANRPATQETLRQWAAVRNAAGAKASSS